MHRHREDYEDSQKSQNEVKSETRKLRRQVDKTPLYGYDMIINSCIKKREMSV